MRKLFKGGNYMRKYGNCFYQVPNNTQKHITVLFDTSSKDPLNSLVAVVDSFPMSNCNIPSESICNHCVIYAMVLRTMDARWGNHIHCSAENHLPLPKFWVRSKHVLSATSAQIFRFLCFMFLLGVHSPCLVPNKYAIALFYITYT